MSRYYLLCCLPLVGCASSIVGEWEGECNYTVSGQLFTYEVSIEVDAIDLNPVRVDTEIESDIENGSEVRFGFGRSRYGLSVEIIPQLFDLATGKAPLSKLFGHPVSPDFIQLIDGLKHAGFLFCGIDGFRQCAQYFSVV